MYIRRYKSQVVGGNNNQIISIKLTDDEMEQVFRIKEEEYRRQDIVNAIQEAYEIENISEEDYQRCKDNEEIICKIMSRYDKTCSCNIAYNVTMEEAVKFVVNGGN